VLAAVMPAGPAGGRLLAPLAALGLASMFVGSVLATVQTDLRRLLAYSGITHAGYLTMAVMGLDAQGAAAGLFYLCAYALMNLGAFAVIVAVSRQGLNGAAITAYRGLFYRHPWLAGAMTLFMLSLTGLPPAAGFIGKLQLLGAAFAAGALPLAVGLVVTSGISAYAYLRVVATMLVKAAEEPGREPVTGGAEGDPAARAETAASAELGLSRGRPASAGALGVIAAAAGGTLYLGVFPQAVLALLEAAFPFV
jgi:NADH:ubiquinone oxidoreductase subunit 2 (subunit N)